MAVMEELYENDKESYDELWAGIRTLNNLGLVDDKISNAMVEKDHQLFAYNNN